MLALKASSHELYEVSDFYWWAAKTLNKDVA